MAFVAALDFLGDREAVLERRGIGLLGFGQEFLNFEVEFLELLLGVAVADGGVFAGVGEDFGAIDGDLADFEDSAAGDHFQNLREGALEEVAFFLPEGAGGVDGLDGVDDEMDEVVGGHSVTYVGWEEHGVSPSMLTNLGMSNCVSGIRPTSKRSFG